MRYLATGFLVVGLLGGSPVGAQDAEHLALARDLLVGMKAADNFDAVLPTIMTALKPALTGGNPKAAKDFDEVVPLMMGEFSSKKGALVDEVAGIYAKSFSKPELKEMVVFYRSPTGQKLARITPALSQEMMVAGQRYGQQVAAQVTERMRDELKKRGNKI